MPDLLEQSATWLEDMRQAFMTRPVTYVRGSESVTVPATIGKTVFQIARDYGLGYKEIGMMYRQWDPFLPPPGVKIMIPTRWIVPDSRGKQIIVNTGEMRLYYYIKKDTQVYTFPIGMGVLDYRMD